MHDLVIRGGTVVDGTGAARFAGDVAIRDGLIVEVGKVAGAARRVIDADGLLVTPGFVDIHTHFDGQASWDPVLAPSSLHGVTSLVMGNCGVGFAPARPDSHDWLIRLLEGVEDIPGTALAEGLTWDWESFPDYLDALARRSYAVDIGTQMPHAALRTYVMGERGGDHTQLASGEEIVRMAQLTAEAVRAGALGFTTSRTNLHRSSSGENIGTLSASREELLGITAALRDTGRGVIQLISDTYLSPDEAFAAREMDLIEEMARTSGRPLSFTVQQPDHAADRWRYLFGRVGAAQRAGVAIRAQVGARAIGILIGLPATLNPFFVTPSYRQIASLPLPQRLAEMRAFWSRAAFSACSA
jgi:N-acyl-D-amino-acid deacylase